MIYVACWYFNNSTHFITDESKYNQTLIIHQYVFISDRKYIVFLIASFPVNKINNRAAHTQKRNNQIFI